ncbi:hypothetical protein [Methanolapillus millepedarum]|uniref:DUF2399 domain-containing protein n=1 Tax=Methanolapillus millepedarum TaxID=3028296 RepID=A0AA96VEI0_9EURY|nr:hypothetical protein MsAc7_06990 [Methanosarcinaceae archaeon Ac7]
MPKIAYIEKRFKPDSLDLIEKVNSIVDDYERQGYSLTLRQVYYQLVSRDVIPNNERSYKNLGNLINDGRLAGMIDWYSIEDRTRFLRGIVHDDDPEELLRSASSGFSLDKWENMDTYVEFWVEKDALVDIVGKACHSWEVDYFSCRGYVSQSEMWSAARRFIRRNNSGKNVVIFHLGDHDPSGIDMSRDIEDRLRLFGADITFERIALNYGQIETYNPPPNPTKLSDSRSTDYVKKYGYECWELDALEPSVLSELISNHVKNVIDLDAFNNISEREGEIRKQMDRFVDTYSDFVLNEEDTEEMKV